MNCGFFGLMAIAAVCVATALARNSIERINYEMQGDFFRSVAQEQRIIDGRSVDITLHPHQISIRRKMFTYFELPHEHACGGSILSSTIAVTAAHCVAGTEPKEWHVTAGSSFRKGSDGVIVLLKDIIVHENFNANDADGDIALLIFSTPLPLNNFTIKAIELSADVVTVGAMATVSGWGITHRNLYADMLQETTVPIISNELCNEDFNPEYLITDAMLCAGRRGVGGEDACDGDSGGPLAINGKLVGIVSWGVGCGSPKYVGVYTRISYHLAWLLGKIAEHQ